jgi:hypothetical protein
MRLLALLAATTAFAGAASTAAFAEQSFIDGPAGIRIVVVDKVLHNIVDTEDTSQAYSASYRPAANFPIPLDPVMGSGAGASGNYRLSMCKLFLKPTERYVRWWVISVASVKGIACSWNGETLVPNPYNFNHFNWSQNAGPVDESALKYMSHAEQSLGFAGQAHGPRTPNIGGRTLVSDKQPFDMGRVWSTASPWNSTDPSLSGKARTDGYGASPYRWETTFSGGDFMPSGAQQAALVAEYQAAGFDPTQMRIANFTGYTGNSGSLVGAPTFVAVEDARLDGTGTPFCSRSLLQTNSMIASAPAKFGGIYCSVFDEVATPPLPPVVVPPIVRPPPVIPDPPRPTSPVETSPGGNAVDPGRPHGALPGGGVSVATGQKAGMDLSSWCRSDRGAAFAAACANKTGQGR